MIIVDDFSQDTSYEIAKKYSLLDKRIKLLSMPQKSIGGAAQVRNFAIDHAVGRFIAYLDSDDVFMPNKLEVQLSFMLEKNIAFSYSDYYVFNEVSNTIAGIYRPRKQVGYSKLLRSNVIGCLTVMYDTESVGKVYMPENVPFREDHATWLNIVRKVKVLYKCPHPLAIYRVRAGSVSSSKFKMIKHQYNMFRNNDKKSRISSFFLTIAIIINSVFKYKKLHKVTTNNNHLKEIILCGEESE